MHGSIEAKVRRAGQVKANASPVAAQAIQRIAWLYRIEADARELTPEQRLAMRQDRSKPLCEELHVWL